MPTRWLTLIRHAKASAEHRGGQRDYDRPLAPRGERDVVRMGRRLAAAGVRPDRILASEARRAEQTARAIAAELGLPDDAIETREALYLAGPRTLLEHVEATEPSVRHLALVGHNPGLSDLGGWLTGDEDVLLPTCGLVRLGFEAADWREAAPGAATLLEFDYPKRLDD